MSDEIYLSADSHVLEPGDIWVRGIPAKFRDSAPRVEYIDGKSCLTGDGLAGRPLSISFAAGKRGENMDYNDTAWENRPVAGYELAARIEAMQADGVSGEVLYPTLGLNMFSLTDPELKRECARAYNRWLGDFAKRSNGHLLAVGLLTVDDPEYFEEDMRYAVECGCSAIMPPVIAAQPWNLPFYDRLFDIAVDMDISLNYHIGAGGKLIRATGPGAAMMNYMYTIEGVQSLAHTMLWSGVLDRRPKLRIGFVEAGIGWIAPLLEKIDDVWSQHNGWARPKLSRRPSDTFRAQCYGTFERDRVGLELRNHVGVGNLMWATDYPHAESAWPDSLKIAEADFEGISEEDRVAIMSGNCMKFFNWTPPKIKSPKLNAA
ncbi:MAG TPA: amidohydrolase family protein [Sphingobium sp.]|uniref:amidohydrolase family protein n=1 Tax=Sphingobium sp. TaxID=1912891 RepID=UPI002ED0E6A1